MGGQLLSTFGEHMRERVDVARKNARALKEHKNPWEGRQKRQEVRRLQDKEARSKRVEERKETRRLRWASYQ